MGGCRGGKPGRSNHACPALEAAFLQAFDVAGSQLSWRACPDAVVVHAAQIGSSLTSVSALLRQFEDEIYFCRFALFTESVQKDPR